jgi:hypothetical protein
LVSTGKGFCQEIQGMPSHKKRRVLERKKRKGYIEKKNKEKMVSPRKI